jgi:hypothetical protein
MGCCRACTVERHAGEDCRLPATRLTSRARIVIPRLRAGVAVPPRAAPCARCSSREGGATPRVRSQRSPSNAEGSSNLCAVSTANAGGLGESDGSVATWSPGPTSRRRPSCTEERSMEPPCQGAVSAARLRRGALGALGRSAPRRACALPAEQDCKPDEVTLGGVRRDRHGSRLSLGRELSMRSP